MDLFTASVFTDYTCICLTETWLDNNVFSSELFCDDFFVYRFDRSSNTSKKTRGGGVLIAIKKTHPSYEIKLKYPSVEMVCAKLQINSNWTYLFNVYIPPDDSIESYNTCLLNIENVVINANSKDQFVIMGDFNLPDILWINSNDEDFNFMVPTNATVEKSTFFIEKVHLLPLFQVNCIINNCGRMLDLIYTDIPNEFNITESVDPLLKIDPYHPPLEFALSGTKSSFSKTKITRSYNFKKCDFNAMSSFLDEIDWSIITNNEDINTALTQFYFILNEAIKRFVPYKEMSANRKHSWISSRLKTLKNKKNSLHKKFKRRNDDAIRNEYNTIKRQLSIETKIAYDNYINDLKESFKTNPKKFWSYINSKRNNDIYPKIMNYDDESADNDNDICELFAKFFNNVYKNDDASKSPNIGLIPVNNTNNFQPPVINNCDIYSAIANVKCCFSPGPDNVPSCILIKCGGSLTDVLCYLFNLSLSSGVFPTIWKSSYIIPLFKKGARHDISNYRGIAKLSAIPKLFEAILSSDLTFKVKSIISNEQHGFCSGKSTLTNLLTLTNTISNGFASKLQTDVGYFDFSKAFDQLNHRILIVKLQQLGFSEKYVQWIYQYLTSRTQSVLFNGYFSRSINVLSGVPQGSHIGPLMFVLYINDLPSVMSSSRILLFADDAKIFKTISSLKDCIELQNDFNNLSTWCNNNDLSINIKKCNILSFCRKRSSIEFEYVLNNSVIERVNDFCDLGVNFDSKMMFNKHIEIIKGKASSRLGMIKRWSKEFHDPYVTKSLYVCLVRSILEYNSSVWCPSYQCHINSLESVQRQFLLFALRSLNWENRLLLPKYEHRLLLIDLNTLQHRRIIQNALFMFKMLKGELNCIELLSTVKIRCPRIILRNYRLIETVASSYNYIKFDPFNLIRIHFNDLIDHFDFNLSLENFRSKLVKYFKRNMLN